MRSERTKAQLGNTLGLALVGVEANGSACTTCGCKRVSSTTSQATSKVAQLSELLNSLESSLETLEYRYSEVLNIFLSVTERLVTLGSFSFATTTIDREEEGE